MWRTMVATSHMWLFKFKKKLYKNSLSVTLAALQVLHSQASGGHLGQHRHKTVLSLQKLLLDTAAIHANEALNHSLRDHSMLGTFKVK